VDTAAAGVAVLALAVVVILAAVAPQAVGKQSI
jgi:hypothetical protein